MSSATVPAAPAAAPISSVRSMSVGYPRGRTSVASRPALLEHVAEVGLRHGSQVALSPFADRDGAVLLVAVADDQHVGHLLGLSVADPGLHPLAARVDLDAKACATQFSSHLVG